MKSAFDQRQEIISMAVHGQVLKDGEPKEIIMVDFISRIDNILKCSIVSQRGIINCLFVVCLKYSNTLHVMVVCNIFFMFMLV